MTGNADPKTCSAWKCDREVPAIARLRGWTRDGKQWLCPDHRGYTVQNGIAAMKASMRAIAPEVGWVEELAQKRQEIAVRRRTLTQRDLDEIAQLGRCFNRFDPVLEKEGLARLEAIGRDSIPRLCRFSLATGEQAVVAMHAVEILAGLSDAEAREAVISACAHDARLVRAAGAAQLRRVDDGRRVGILLTLLKDDWNTTRARAAESLGFIGDAVASSALASLLADADPNVSSAGAVSLARLSDSRGFPFLIVGSASADASMAGFCRERLKELDLPNAADEPMIDFCRERLKEFGLSKLPALAR